MSAFDAIFSGPPSGAPFPAAGATVTSGLDTNTGAEWVNVGKGWQPNNSAVAKAAVVGTTAAQATLLVFTVPVTGLYRVTFQAAQANSTSGTLPTVTLAWTDGDNGTVLTSQAFVTGAATTGEGQSQSANTEVFAKAGTTITVNAGAPTTTTVNERARIEYLG